MKSAFSLVLLSALLLGGCTTKQMTQTELYFGMARKDGAKVSDEQWQQFLDEVVTPRFPDGFTVTITEGQWRGPDGKIIREPSRVLNVVRDRGPEASRKLDEIRQIYKETFNQDAVLRVDDFAEVKF
jgi:major membrane immunogen (membrane-anchored lipoprotein)